MVTARDLEEAKAVVTAGVLIMHACPIHLRLCKTLGFVHADRQEPPTRPFEILINFAFDHVAREDDIKAILSFCRMAIPPELHLRFWGKQLETRRGPSAVHDAQL